MIEEYDRWKTSLPEDPSEPIYFCDFCGEEMFHEQEAIEYQKDDESFVEIYCEKECFYEAVVRDAEPRYIILRREEDDDEYY